MLKLIQLAWGKEVIFVIAAGLVASMNHYPFVKDYPWGVPFLVLVFVLLPFVVGTLGYGYYRQTEDISNENRTNTIFCATLFIVVAYMMIVVFEYVSRLTSGHGS
jgi:uncharacterized membrane protein YidH (DUF202 family)